MHRGPGDRRPCRARSRRRTARAPDQLPSSTPIRAGTADLVRRASGGCSRAAAGSAPTAARSRSATGPARRRTGSSRARTPDPESRTTRLPTVRSGRPRLRRPGGWFRRSSIRSPGDESQCARKRIRRRMRTHDTEGPCGSWSVRTIVVHRRRADSAGSSTGDERMEAFAMSTARGSKWSDLRAHCEPGELRRNGTWSIVLAGGDGTRLMGASVGGYRVDRPKQFCRFGADDSLLRSTLDRVFRRTPPARLLPVVSQKHYGWWTDELRDIPVENVIVQPRNRGTAIAILHALITIFPRDPDAVIVVHPSDHGVEQDAPWNDALDQAIAIAGAAPDDLVLLGIVPGDPETEYGWIVP